MKYKLQSDELQLITIINSICTDGTANIGPSFMFPGSTKHKEWFEEPGAKYLYAAKFKLSYQSIIMLTWDSHLKELQPWKMGGQMMKSGLSGLRKYLFHR